VAVINIDDGWGRRLVAMLRPAGTPIQTFSMADAIELRVGPDGSRFRWRGTAVSLHLGGRFNVENGLAAATAAAALGVPEDAVAAGLDSVSSVRGRFERIDAGQPFAVIVDYAHTPDGLERALAAARELSHGRLVVVFGAGGDRDHGKRPLMGEAAARLADLVVLTSDNPRSEDPEVIIAEVLAGIAPGAAAGAVTIEPDRARAIEAAFSAAGHDDVVLIAGKGHETGQEIAGRVVPFDDAEVARRILEQMGHRGRGTP
jgi:UDP-N-acetylmuramoyl-L-alanyl-D-glutamate--2,6-diaminopimelate ligase